MTDSTPLLVTICFSHYCEKARWGLEQAGLPFREEAHLPLFHYLANLRHGGRRTVPALCTRDQVYRDSTEILLYADRQTGTGRLYPQEPRQRLEALDLEDHFDRRLGPATRLVVYAHLLPDRPLALRFMGAMDVPPLERRLLPVMLPLARQAITRGYGITPERTARSLTRIREVFDEVGERLRDGRRFLIGDRFTAADLTFAALAAPVLVPPEYGVPLPQPEALAPELAAVVRELRETPAGAFALRLYREHRRPAQPQAVAG